MLTYSVHISGSLSVLLHGLNSGEGVITFVKDGKADYPRLERKVDFHRDFRVQNKTSHKTAPGTMRTHTICCRSVGAGIPPSPAGTWGLELREAKELACGQMALRSGRFSKCVESQSFFSI